jgi:hypothetical protein
MHMNQLAPIATFDYGALDMQIADSLRKQAQRIRERVKTTTCTIIEIGRDILAVKQHLDHGQFSKWVEAECGFNIRTAQRYMGAAEFAADKYDIVSFLEPAIIYRLAAKSIPPAIITEVVARVQAGERLNASGVGRLISVARQEAAKAERNNRRSRKPSETQKAKEIEDRRQGAAIGRGRRRCQQASVLGPFIPDVGDAPWPRRLQTTPITIAMSTEPRRANAISKRGFFDQWTTKKHYERKSIILSLKRGDQPPRRSALHRLRTKPLRR